MEDQPPRDDAAAGDSRRSGPSRTVIVVWSSSRELGLAPGQLRDQSIVGFVPYMNAIPVTQLPAFVNALVHHRIRVPSDVFWVTAPNAEEIVELRTDMSVLRMLPRLNRLLRRMAETPDPTVDQEMLFFSWREPDELRDTDATGLPSTSIYVADENIASDVEAAVEAWLASAGLVVEARDRPVIASWFRRLRIGVEQAVHSGVAQDAALIAVHAADSRFVLYQDAQTTALLLQNLGPVIAALQPTKDAVVRAGALLIVKVDWQVQVFQLTAAQQAILDHRPRLASQPDAIIQALQLTHSNDGEALPAVE